MNVDIQAMEDRITKETTAVEDSVTSSGDDVVIRLNRKQVQALLYFIGLHPEAENHPISIGIVRGLERIDIDFE